MTVIDAHLHLWDRAANSYPWITSALGALDADFSAQQARTELDAAGVDSAVLVQASDTLAETRWMLATAEQNPWIIGVVGWVQLDDPRIASAMLEELADQPLLCGIRHLLHDDPRDLLDDPAVRDSLREVAARGLAFDVPDAWPRNLDAAGRVAEAIPELTVVIDHLGKPPADADERAAWQAALTRVADAPNTVAKFSGLEAIQPTPAALGTLLDLALELFGAHRLMYGGDWPMTVLSGGYGPFWQATSALLAARSDDERDALLRGTAERVYGREGTR
jgi:L-fuconolactonase